MNEQDLIEMGFPAAANIMRNEEFATKSKVKRFFVKGLYADVVYAEDEEQAKEKYLEMNEKLNRTEPFDEIIVEEKPIY